jgi:hypothetical protein
MAGFLAAGREMKQDHKVLDIAFDEDRCRVCKVHGLENFALLR